MIPHRIAALMAGAAALGGAAPVSYSTEAAALFARMTSQPDATRKGRINAVIVALKSGATSGSNIWAKLDALYVMAAADAQAAGLNWIADAYNLTPTNSPTFTADRGYQGDGATSYLDTGFNPTTASSPHYTLNSAHIGLWSRTAAQGIADMGQGTAVNVNPGIYLKCRDASDKATFALNSPTSGLGNGAQATNTDGSGHFIANRSGSTSGASDTAMYRNGAALTLSGQDASTALGNANIVICGGNGGTASTRQFAAGSIGASLSAAEALDLYNALQTYMTGVGA